jgi:hypothetical protein
MIWKDVGVFAFWTLAVGLLLQRERHPRNAALWLGALFALFYGAAVRHNAWPEAALLALVLMGVALREARRAGVTQ